MPLELENTITSKLSSDLINRILDCLHDDMPTLSACSLVSRSWLPRCRSHKFRSVDLGRALPLIPLLLKCPDIGRYVRNVEVYSISGTGIVNYYAEVVIRQLSNVTGLTVSDINNTTFKPLRRLGDTVRHLCFRSCPYDETTLIWFISSFSHVTDIIFSEVSLRDQIPTLDSLGKASKNARSSRPMPHTITIQSVFWNDAIKLTKALVSSSLCSRVKCMILMTVDDADIPTLDDLMEAAGTSLTELQIGFFKLGDGSKEFDNVLDVSPCTNLRSLRFRSPATYPLRRSLDWDESCCIIAEFLEQFEEPQIEQIAFDLTKDDTDGLRSSAAWQDVIDVLMSPPFSSLERVICSIDPSCSNKAEIAEAVRSGGLADFDARGILEVNEDVSPYSLDF